MVRLDVSLRDLSTSPASSWADPDDMPIQPGSWSDWAVRKVVVSHADNERPNLIAWIIARFFVDAKDAAAFMGVSQQSARAILGQPNEDAHAADGEGPVTADDLLMVREIAATFARRTSFHPQQPPTPDQLPLFEQLHLGLKNGKAALGARFDVMLGAHANDLFCEPFPGNARRLCDNVETYGERGGLYLSAAGIADCDIRALCSTITAMWNMGELERLTESHGVDIYFDDTPPPTPHVIAPSRSSSLSPPPAPMASLADFGGIPTRGKDDAEPLLTRATAHVCEWFQYVVDASG